MGAKPKQAMSQRGSHVTQNLTGGTWIQGKRLAENAATPVEKRVRRAVDEACAKFEGPVRKGDLLIHVEVPDLSRQSAAEQQRLRAAANEQLRLWTDAEGKYEGLPIKVQVVEAPPDPPAER